MLSDKMKNVPLGEMLAVKLLVIRPTSDAVPGLDKKPSLVPSA
jgi:hypothetical protein